MPQWYVASDVGGIPWLEWREALIVEIVGEVQIPPEIKVPATNEKQSNSKI
jgi:hypothetical protein